jgi:hypothetical protein
MTIKVVVPVTSLCPCSKEISKYGAHNQRSHVTVTVRTNTFVWIEDLIDLVESQASCELYGLLKRPDEKYVTERAYENPKFVEDMVRDVAARLNADERIDAYVVESENFESIHNHSAYAMIMSASCQCAGNMAPGRSRTSISIRPDATARMAAECRRASAASQPKRSSPKGEPIPIIFTRLFMFPAG